MDTGTVGYLADLARLDIGEHEREIVAGELGSILGFIDEIQNVDVSAVDAGVSAVNGFREDIVVPITPAHDLVEAAAAHQDHFVKVPKVL